MLRFSLSTLLFAAAFASFANVKTRPVAPDGAVERLRVRGYLHQQRRQFDQAIFDFSEALLFEVPRRTKAELYAARGNIYVFKKDFARASADVEEAVRLAPDYFPAYHVRARILLNQSRFDLALIEINRAIKLQPDFAGLYVSRGDILERQNQLSQALENYNRAIALQSNLPAAYFGRALVEQEMKKHADALADYHRSVELGASDENLYYNRALIYLDDRDYPNALTNADAYLRAKPTDVEGFIVRAKVFRGQHEYLKALADGETARQLEPENPRVLNFLAWMRATCPEDSIRDGHQAIDEAMRACEITDWREGDSIDTLAAAFAEVGDFAQAIKYQEQAIGLLAQDQREDAEARLVLFQQRKPWRDYK